MGSKFFPFRDDPFIEESWHAVKQKGSHKICLPWQKNGGNIYHVSNSLKLYMGINMNIYE